MVQLYTCLERKEPYVTEQNAASLKIEPTVSRALIMLHL